MATGTNKETSLYLSVAALGTAAVTGTYLYKEIQDLKTRFDDLEKKLLSMIGRAHV